MSEQPEVVYGRRPVHEVLRAGRRAIVELNATERAVKVETWLSEIDGLRPIVTPERDLSELAGSRDHQGVVALCEPYGYVEAHALADMRDPLILCLDGVTDPQNLGAICRSAEAAGANGLVLPEHASARVTPAVCKTSAGAVEHLGIGIVVNLARFLNEIKRSDLWVWAASGDGHTPYWDADLKGGVALVLGAEGKGLRPSVRKACDGAVSVPLVGEVGSLNVSVAAGVIAFEAARQRAPRQGAVQRGTEAGHADG